MEILDLIRVFFTFISSAWIVCFLLVSFLGNDHQRSFFWSINEWAIDWITYKLPMLLTNIWMILATILHFIGNFTVLLLLCGSIFALGRSIFNYGEEFNLSGESIYTLIKFLTDDKVAVYAATSIVALTVAIGHMLKWNLEKRKYYQEDFEKRLEKAKKQQGKVRRPAYNAYVSKKIKNSDFV